VGGEKKSIRYELFLEGKKKKKKEGTPRSCAVPARNRAEGRALPRGKKKGRPEKKKSTMKIAPVGGKGRRGGLDSSGLEQREEKRKGRRGRCCTSLRRPGKGGEERA